MYIFASRTSSTTKVTSRVLQEGHLSPLLFLLFDNDLNKYFNNCKLLLFVDNMKIFIPIRSTDDDIFFQRDLDQFSERFSLNGMSLNTFKCVHISFNHSKFHTNSQFYIDGTSLLLINQVNNLGIIMSANLFFSFYINTIYCKSLRVL